MEIKTSVRTKCKLVALKCYRASESDGDEVFIKAEGKKLWPQQKYASIKETEEVTINLILPTHGHEKIVLELWESDLFSSELLGYFQFTLNGEMGQYSTDLKLRDPKSNHRYALLWEI